MVARHELAGFSEFAALLPCVVFMVACSSDPAGSGGSGGLAADASPTTDANLADALAEVISGSGGAGGGQDPGCAAADRHGFFSDCSLCGTDCDTIDDGTSTRHACGCSNGCPCGLHCGSYEIAPNVSVSDICIR
jgi:hypothetical protein